MLAASPGRELGRAPIFRADANNRAAYLGFGLAWCKSKKPRGAQRDKQAQHSGLCVSRCRRFSRHQWWSRCHHYHHCPIAAATASSATTTLVTNRSSEAIQMPYRRLPVRGCKTALCIGPPEKFTHQGEAIQVSVRRLYVSVIWIEPFDEAFACAHRR